MENIQAIFMNFLTEDDSKWWNGIINIITPLVNWLVCDSDNTGIAIGWAKGSNSKVIWQPVVALTMRSH